MEETTLSAAFLKLQKLHSELTDSSSAEDLAEALKYAELCHRFINSLSLYSKNETAEDIPTGDLQYGASHFASALIHAGTYWHTSIRQISNRNIANLRREANMCHAHLRYLGSSYLFATTWNC